MNRIFTKIYEKLFNEMRLNSIDSEKGLSIRSYQQMAYLSTFVSMSLSAKCFVLNKNNKTIDKTLNNRNLWTDLRQFQKKDSNENPNGFKSRRTQRILNDNQNNKIHTNYDILGVDPKATEKDIKRAYYEKSKLCHPDLNQGLDAEQEFRKINAAYEVLGNKESKRQYDMKMFRKSLRDSNTNSDTSVVNDFHFNNNIRNNRNDNDFNDNEDYTQFWKNRSKRQKYQNIKTDSKQRYRGVDPLKYDTKDFFKHHFTEEMQKEYEEQIKKRDDLYKQDMAERTDERNIMVKGFLTLIVFYLIGNFIIECFDTNKNKVNKNKSDDNK